MVTGLGRSPAQLPTAVRESAVKCSVGPTNVDTLAVALHWPPPLADRSKDRKPENESAVATPLIAPCQSDVELIHAPSTQLPVWTTVKVMVRVGKLADSNVPVQVPEKSAKIPVAPGVGEAVDEPHALLAHTRSTAPRANVRLKTTDGKRGSPARVPTGFSPAAHASRRRRAARCAR